MALLIRHRCQRCGAASEGSPPEGSWVRCPFCRSLLDFDWLGFFDSPAYASYLANAAQAGLEGWPRYQAAIAEGEARLARGEREGALASLREAVELMIELTPFMYPPEVRTDSAYREAMLTLQAWWLLQCRADQRVASLQKKLEAQLRTIDFRDPLPALRPVVALMREQTMRLAESDAPPDPDGMPPLQRARIWASVMLGAWVRMLSPEQRLTLLKELHGEANVREVGSGSGDDLGLFVELGCPACGLHSLQSRSAPEWVCLGCFLRRAAPSSTTFEAVDLPCPTCKAAIHLGPADREVTCSYCGAAVRRVAESGSVLREYTEGVMHDAAARAGIAPPEKPTGDVPGLPVTAANRQALAVSGLARTASAYAHLITPARFGQLVRSTATALGLGPRDLIGELRRSLTGEISEPGKALIEATGATLP